jgi:hypothetical protein
VQLKHRIENQHRESPAIGIGHVIQVQYLIPVCRLGFILITGPTKTKMPNVAHSKKIMVGL